MVEQKLYKSATQVVVAIQFTRDSFKDLSKLTCGGVDELKIPRTPNSMATCVVHIGSSHEPITITEGFWVLWNPTEKVRELDVLSDEKFRATYTPVLKNTHVPIGLPNMLIIPSLCIGILNEGAGHMVVVPVQVSENFCTYFDATIWRYDILQDTFIRTEHEPLADSKDVARTLLDSFVKASTTDCTPEPIKSFYFSRLEDVIYPTLQAVKGFMEVKSF